MLKVGVDNMLPFPSDFFGLTNQKLTKLREAEGTDFISWHMVAEYQQAIFQTKSGM